MQTTLPLEVKSETRYINPMEYHTVYLTWNDKSKDYDYTITTEKKELRPVCL